MGTDKRIRGRDRVRVLQPAKQRATGLAVLPAEVPGEADSVRPQILVELCRAFIRLNPSGDMLWLALNEAQVRTGASDEEMALLKTAIRKVVSSTAWPEGFFSEL